jgi:hypothetical protein
VDETDTPQRAGLRRPGGNSSDAIVVACQRHPWIASAALCLGVGGAATAGLLGAPDRTRVHDVLALLPLVTASFASVGHIGRGARATADRLAPWLAANAVALSAAMVLSSARVWRASFTGMLTFTLIVAVWPLASAALLPGTPPGDETPVAAVAFPAAIVVLPPASALLLARGGPEFVEGAWAIAAWLCVLLIPLAVHALVRSRMPTRLLLALSLACGAAWEVLHPGERRTGIVSALLAPAAALAVGLLVVAARRARSMTAVPVDHPIVEDFGGR